MKDNILSKKKEQRQKLFKDAIGSYNVGFFLSSKWSEAHTPSILENLDPSWIKIRKDSAHFVNETYWRIHMHLLQPMTFGSVPEDKKSESVASVDEDYPPRQKNISVFKILSGTELAFTYASPFGIFPGEIGQEEKADLAKIRGLLNAHLGFYCALHLLSSWPGYKDILTTERLMSLIQLDPLILHAPGEYTLGLLDEHLRFLISAKPESNLPVMGNAIWWRLFAGRLYSELSKV